MTPTEDSRKLVEGTYELPRNPETEGLQASRNNVETVLEDPYKIKVREEIFEQPHQGRSYHLTNPHGMGLGKEAVDGVNYKVGEKIYTLTDDGRVYSYSEECFSFTPVQIEDPAIVDAVRSQRDENEAIRKARYEKAEVLAGGDSVLKEIYRRHLDFTKGNVQSTKMPEGTFFAVGENDWFTFYAGQVGGQKKIYAASKGHTHDGEKIIDLEEFGYTGDTEILEAFPVLRREPSKDKAAHHYNCAGSMWSENLSGDLYRLNHEEYVVSGNGSVYQKEDMETVVTDPVVLLSIKAQIEEDIKIRAARDALATREAQGDPKLLLVLMWHLEFNGGRITLEPLEKDGIKFYQVGRNASHQFCLGVQDGKMYKYATDGGYWNEETGEYVPDDSEVYEVESNNVGYVGHF